MGFFDTMKKVGNAAANVAQAMGDAAQEKHGEFLRKKEAFERKSDSELKEIIEDDGFFGSSEMDKNIARRVLQERRG